MSVLYVLVFFEKAARDEIENCRLTQSGRLLLGNAGERPSEVAES